MLQHVIQNCAKVNRTQNKREQGHNTEDTTKNKGKLKQKAKRNGKRNEKEQTDLTRSRMQTEGNMARNYLGYDLHLVTIDNKNCFSL